MLDREIKRQWGYLNSNLSCPLFVSNNYKMKALINKHIYFFCIIMLLLYILRRVWSSVVKCESIPSIKLTLDPQLAFDWHSLFSKDLNQHVNQYSVDTRPTLHWHSVDIWLIVWYLIEYTWSKEPSFYMMITKIYLQESIKCSLFQCPYCEYLGKVHLIWQGGMKILKLEAWNFRSPPR